MKQVGTVDRIFRGTFCFLKVVGKEDHFAHRKDFISPEFMKIGQPVKFDPIEVQVPGRWKYAATNVEPIAA
jgi:hypothetical protein